MSDARGTSASAMDVLTPSYGYGRFIADALDSVASQAGVSCTHIVQDGGSTDGTVDVLRERSGERLLWRSEADDGQSDALNRALAGGRAPWISWLNADEFYLPGALEHLLAEAHSSGADVVYGDAVFVDEHGALVRLLPQHRFSELVLRHYGAHISTCAMVARRQCVEQVGWRTGFRKVMDWDIYVRLLDEGAGFRYTPYPVGAFRLHPDQVTAGPQASYEDEYTRIRAELGVRPTRAHEVGSRLAHAALKAVGGAYTRQTRAAALKGKDLRWFRNEAAAAAVEELLSSVYRRGRPT